MQSNLSQLNTTSAQFGGYSFDRCFSQAGRYF